MDAPKLSLIGQLGGKKLLMALSSVIGVILTSKLGLTEQQASEVIQAIMLFGGVFMAGQTVVDVATKGATSSSTLTVDPAEMARIQLQVQLSNERAAAHQANTQKAIAQQTAMAVLNQAPTAPSVQEVTVNTAPAAPVFKGENEIAAGL